MWKVYGTFVAAGDNGRTYTVHAFLDGPRPAIPVGGPRPPPCWDGMFETSDGLSVRCLDYGEYRVERTGVRLHTTDPAA